MKRALLVVGLVACTRDSVIEEPAVAPAPAPTPVPHPPPEPAPPPTTPKLGTIVRIETRGGDTLCMHDAATKRCVELVVSGGKLAQTIVDPKSELKLELAGTPCTYDGSVLACDDGLRKPLAHSGAVDFGYLHDGERVYWYAPSDDRAKLSEVRTFSGGIAQLSVRFRAACALAGNGEVWCWANPAAPKRVATPPKVAEIMVQDPFALCVRTTTGEVHCGPAFVQQDSLFCHKDKIACGTGGVEQRELTTSFDPLAKLARPLRRVSLPGTIDRLVRDEDQLYLFCLDSLAVQVEPLGGCALASDGSVACFGACGAAWKTTRVKGLPAVSKIWSDDRNGYALAAGGALWTWRRGLFDDECAKWTDVTAERVPDIAVTDLAPPLFARSGPQNWDLYRCALLADATVRCWSVDHAGTRGTLFEPLR
jgi:hypothetical protein